jgi:hypothetical protein
MRVPDPELKIENTKVLINGTELPIIEVKLIPGIYSDINRLSFNWTLASFAPASAKI